MKPFTRCDRSCHWSLCHEWSVYSGSTAKSMWSHHPFERRVPSSKPSRERVMPWPIQDLLTRHSGIDINYLVGPPGAKRNMRLGGHSELAAWVGEGAWLNRDRRRLWKYDNPFKYFCQFAIHRLVIQSGICIISLPRILLGLITPVSYGNTGSVLTRVRFADSFIYFFFCQTNGEYLGITRCNMFIWNARSSPPVELKNATIFILKSGLSATVDLYVHACNGPITISPLVKKSLFPFLPTPFFPLRVPWWHNIYIEKHCSSLWQTVAMLFFIQMNASCVDESRRFELDIFFSLGQFIKVHRVFRATATNHHCQNCMYICEIL